MKFTLIFFGLVKKDGLNDAIMSLQTSCGAILRLSQSSCLLKTEERLSTNNKHSLRRNKNATTYGTEFGREARFVRCF